MRHPHTSSGAPAAWCHRLEALTRHQYLHPRRNHRTCSSLCPALMEASQTPWGPKKKTVEQASRLCWRRVEALAEVHRRHMMARVAASVTLRRPHLQLLMFRLLEIIVQVDAQLGRQVSWSIRVHNGSSNGTASASASTVQHPLSLTAPQRVEPELPHVPPAAPRASRRPAVPPLLAPACCAARRPTVPPSRSRSPALLAR